jgi:hypothetical protein
VDRSGRGRSIRTCSSLHAACLHTFNDFLMCPVCSLAVQVPQVASSQEVVLIPSYWYLSLNADVTQHMDLQQAGLLMYRCAFLQQIIIKCSDFAQVANQLC